MTKQYFPDLPYWCKYYEDSSGRIAAPTRKLNKLTGTSTVILLTKFSCSGHIFKFSFEVDGPIARLDELGAALRDFHALIKEKTGIDL